MTKSRSKFAIMLASLLLGLTAGTAIQSECVDQQLDTCRKTRSCKGPESPEVGECEVITYQSSQRYSKVIEYYTTNFCGAAPASEGHAPTLCGLNDSQLQPCAKVRVYPAQADDCDEMFYTDVDSGIPDTCAGSECEYYV